MIRALGIALLALAVTAGAASAAPCGPTRCHLFRAATGAGGAIAAGPDGALWFAGRGFVGRMSLGGAVTRVSAPSGPGSDVAAGADGAVWFTTGDGRLGRVGADRTVALYPTGLRAGLSAIAAGPDGGMWFAGGNTAGRLGPDGRVARFSLPAPAGGRDSLAAGPDGGMWVGGGTGSVMRLSASGLVTGRWELGTRVGGLAAGPDGGIWLTLPDAKRVERISPLTGRVTTFRTSQTPGRIAGGPSHAVWFTMHAPGRRQSVVRLVPAGFQTFFQVRRGARGLAVGANDGIFITESRGIERLTPFLGARVIRSRSLRVNRFAGSASLRLFCPKLDLVFCAGRITLRRGGRVLGSTPFSQRVNDAPATRLLLNSYGRRVTRPGRRVRVRMTIVQHDQGGSRRRTTQALYLRAR